MVNRAKPWRGLMVRIAIMLTICLATTAFACSKKPNTKDAVMTAAAAISSARQSWDSMYEKLNRRNGVYGKNETSKFDPYIATLSDGVWLVRGTIPPGFHGETIETRICQNDGSVSLVVVEVKE